MSSEREERDNIFEQERIEAEKRLLETGIMEYGIKKEGKQTWTTYLRFTDKFMKHYWRYKDRIYQRMKDEYPDEAELDEEFDGLDDTANYELILIYLGIFTEEELENGTYDKEIHKRITDDENQLYHCMALAVSSEMETNDKKRKKIGKYTISK